MVRLSFPLQMMDVRSTIEAAPPSTPELASHDWLRDGVLICLGLKVLLIFLGVVVSEIRFDRPFRDRDKIFAIWYKWDATHYFDLAVNGYELPDRSTNLVLTPLLPMLIRAGEWFTGSLGGGGILVATVLSFFPGLLLYQLARCDLNADDSFRAMLVLLLFPSSFFIHITYTEGLFLTVVLAAFLAARKGHWKAVAFFGFLAGLTRINAFVLAPALLIEAWGRSARGRFPRILAALAVGVGIAIYLGINYAVAGDPLAFVSVQRDKFFRTFATPWEGAINVWRLAAVGGSDSMMNGVLQLLAIPALIITCWVAVAKQRASYAVWMIGNTLVFTAQGFWLSLPRLALVLFPAFIWLAPKTARPVFGTLWFAGSTLFLSFLACQFAQGWWVS